MKVKTRAKLLGVAFVLPTLIIIILFGIIPIISSIRYSFSNWDGVTITEFVGLQNYIDAMHDSTMLKAMGNTMKLTFSCIVINLIVGYSLANLLFRMRGRSVGFGKVVLFIPYILSFAAVGVLFSFIFSSTNLGLLNKIITMLGFQKVPWLGRKSTAMASLIFAYSWKDFGLSMLLFYAALQSMPASLLEAGDIDGASELQKTRHIKLPYMRNTVQTLVVLGVVRYMLTFTMIMFLTPEGGPSKSTEVVATWFYKQSFKFWNFGYGAALALILTVMVLITTLILRRVFRVEEM
jgi:ABC-type sugar transport system permease subunit